MLHGANQKIKVARFYGSRYIYVCLCVFDGTWKLSSKFVENQTITDVKVFTLFKEIEIEILCVKVASIVVQHGFLPTWLSN